MLARLLSIVLLGLLLSGATCERTVELDIAPPPPRLVINSSFTLGQSVRVSVSKSQYILDNDLPEYVANATVTLWEGDTQLEKLVLYVDPAPRIAPYYTTTQVVPRAGITYTIRAEAPGYAPVEAKSFIPAPVTFTQFQVFDLQTLPGSSSFTQRYSYQVFLDFNDPPGQDNYFHLNIFQEIQEYAIRDSGDTAVVSSRLVRAILKAEAPDIVQDAVIGGLLLKNKPLPKGFTFELSNELAPEFERFGKVIAELRTVSEEYYLYYSTFSRQQRQTDGPFNDPVVIFNNIKNGHGYFAGYNTVQDSVSIGF